MVSRQHMPTHARTQAHMLRLVAAINPRFGQLFRLVKAWAKAHGMNNGAGGTFNSWCLSLVVVFYCQTRSGVRQGRNQRQVSPEVWDCAVVLGGSGRGRYRAADVGGMGQQLQGPWLCYSDRRTQVWGTYQEGHHTHTHIQRSRNLHVGGHSLRGPKLFSKRTRTHTPHPCGGVLL